MTNATNSSTGFNPVVDPENGANVTDPSGSEGIDSAVGEGIQGFSELIEVLMSNPTVIVGLVLLAGVAYILYKKVDERAKDDEFTGKDWGEIIPSDLKYMVTKAGLEADKDLTRGDTTDLGKVFKYDTFEMPQDMEYEELLFGNFDEEEAKESEETEEVYVFLVAPSGDFGRMLWKTTDIYFNMNTSTMMYVVSSERVTEEHGRFKLEEKIDFKREYGNIMVEKGVATENVTDQFPLYQARKNIVEGLEEFTMKALFLDRQHSTAIAQMREDVDEEALQRFLNKGKNF